MATLRPRQLGPTFACDAKPPRRRNYQFRHSRGTARSTGDEAAVPARHPGGTDPGVHGPKANRPSTGRTARNSPVEQLRADVTGAWCDSASGSCAGDRPMRSTARSVDTGEETTVSNGRPSWSARTDRRQPDGVDLGAAEAAEHGPTWSSSTCGSTRCRTGGSVSVSEHYVPDRANAPRDLLEVIREVLGADPPVLVQPRIKQGKPAKVLIEQSADADCWWSARAARRLSRAGAGPVSQHVAASAVPVTWSAVPIGRAAIVRAPERSAGRRDLRAGDVPSVTMRSRGWEGPPASERLRAVLISGT